MSDTKLCGCCFTVDSCTTTIGILQLNACLYFTARFSCFTQYYWPIDLLFSMVYVVRSLAFIMMQLNKCEFKYREFYYKV